MVIGVKAFLRNRLSLRMVFCGYDGRLGLVLCPIHFVTHPQKSVQKKMQALNRKAYLTPVPCGH